MNGNGDDGLRPPNICEDNGSGADDNGNLESQCLSNNSGGGTF